MLHKEKQKMDENFLENSNHSSDISCVLIERYEREGSHLSQFSNIFASEIEETSGEQNDKKENKISDSDSWPDNPSYK